MTDPTNPTLVTTIMNAPAFDMKVRYPYLYAVEGNAGSVGGAIYDITNPASPVYVDGMRTAHNITIADNGYIYYAITGVAAADLNPDPTAPNFIWDDGEPTWYVGHDVTVVGDRMYDFSGWGQVVRVYDIASFNSDTTSAPMFLDSFSDLTQMSYPHNGWPSVDGNTLYVTDELSPPDQPDLLAWDITDIGDPGFTPTITDTYMDEDATIHNAMVLNNFLYVAYYSAGAKVFDISTPGQMKLVDEYDTSATTGDGFSGAWGMHCLFGDYFYVSDMQNGLYIFKLAPAPSLWKDCGVAVAADARNGSIGPSEQPEPDYSVTDGAGGAIILFDPQGSDNDIYAQRVDVNGNCLWGPNGVQVVDVTGGVIFADAIPDGNGGAIILWTDPRDTAAERDVYVQWIEGDAGTKFPANGLLVSPNDPGDVAEAQALQMINDTEFVVLYRENATIASTSSLYAQRFDDTGTPQWASPARPCLVLNSQLHADMCEDGEGGVFVVWDDDRAGPQRDIYAQRLDASGVRQYGLGGLAISASSDDEQRPRIAYVNGGDVMMAWTRIDGLGNTNVEAAEVSESGVVSWSSLVSSAAGIKRDLQIAFDGSSGLYLAWEDYRSSSNWDIYAMHLHGSGGAVAGWTADGEPVATEPVDEEMPTLARSVDNSMIIAWSEDPDSAGTIKANIYSNFAAPYIPGGAVLCGDADVGKSPSLAVDGNGDAIIAWRDSRIEGTFAHRMEASCGTLGGNVPPMITSVADTPGDAGGFVDVTWDAAGQDGTGMVVQDYDILFAENYQFGWNPTGVTVAASGQSSYSATVPTTQDGTPVWFQVVANGGITTCTWESLPAAGVSMDDPPAAPQNLQVQQVGNYYHLTWIPPDPIVPDFLRYDVFRAVVSLGGGAPARAAAAWTKIGETTTEAFVDETAAPGPSYEWSVVAVDTAGQGGAYADADTVEDTVTDVPSPSYPDLLAGNYPNPFSRTTEVRFSLSQPGPVELNVYDVLGRRVATQNLGRMPSGEYGVPFDGSALPSGIYFYRIKLGDRTFTGKMAIRR